MKSLVNFERRNFCVLLSVCALILTESMPSRLVADDLEIRPFLKKHCVKCHGGEKVK